MGSPSVQSEPQIGTNDYRRNDAEVCALAAERPHQEGSRVGPARLDAIVGRSRAGDGRVLRLPPASRDEVLAKLDEYAAYL
jgi:hypothetical protein